MRTAATVSLALLGLASPLALPACSKADPAPPAAASATAVPSEAHTFAIQGTPPSASSASSASSPASASAVTPPAVASASAHGSAGAVAPAAPPAAKPAAAVATAAAVTTGAAATPKTIAAQPAATPPPAPAATKPAATRISGKNFVLDVASPGCRAGETCVATLHVSTTGEFHVNKEYPYKFTASAAPDVTFLGNGDANTFSRAAGDFREDGEKAATMTVRFKAAKAGEAKVAGTYKMSVCSADQCQIEAQAIALAVPVM